MNKVFCVIRTAALLLALGVSLSGTSLARAQDLLTDQPQLPDDATLITDPDTLRALLTDRTVHAIYLPDGSNWREFSAGDGRTIWDEGTCIRPGTWRISGSVVCYTYPSWDEGRPQCFVVYRSTQATHFVVLDSATGERYLVSNAYEILDGNPDGLPLDATKPLCNDVNT
jgi:hypothetical protein